MIRKNRLKKLFFPLLLAATLFSCSRSGKESEQIETAKFAVSEFDPLTNWEGEDGSSDTLRKIYLDYTRAMTEGFMIPTVRQVKEGYFVFQFSIRQKTADGLVYKIYYENESYAMPLTDGTSGRQGQEASSNFYGSWEETATGFKEIKSGGQAAQIQVIDSFRIVGNPRNEKKCYKEGKNERWKRNPRVGNYRFMLVVTSASALQSFPEGVKDISKQNDGTFTDPFYYFLHGAGSRNSEVAVIASAERLKVIARPDLGKGIFYNESVFTEDAGFMGDRQCGNDSSLYHNAPFEQFIHYIDASTNMENIPVIADVLGGNYSRRDYNWNRSFIRREELISTTPKTAAVPCQTVYSDPEKKQIVIHNPKSTFGKWRKENVGIISRHGLCYGKYRVKAKLTEELNRNNMWNGITNAIWLINQSAEEWNLRRPCNKEGYMETYWGGPKDNRVPRVGYSEIDFEILKTPSYCPDQLFPPVYRNPSPDARNVKGWDVPWPEEIVSQDGMLSVACTNWDMACWEPENFGVGCQPITYQGQQFESHRWDHWYRAITQKTPTSDDEMFAGPYYYFEIDWRPEEIIWRIGPEPDKMRVVGYMNKTMTSVPDNQMLLIVTQEFHNTQWWPGSPYQQSNIPFPKSDIFGYIYEVTVE